MAANQAMIDASPAEIAVDMMARMEALAASSEWSRVEQLAVRLKSAVLDVPENERQSVAVAIAHSLERVQTIALVSHGEVKEKLSEIHRGRAATRAYGQPKGTEVGASLR